MWSNKWPVLVAAVLAAAIAVVLLYKPAPTAQNTAQQNVNQYVNWSNINFNYVDVPFNYGGPPPIGPLLFCEESLTLVYTYRLPKNYTIVGPLGEVARSASRRLAWHIASLTVSFGNDTASARSWIAKLLPGRRVYWPSGLCNVTIEVRTQVVELFVNGTWVEVPPALIRGNYTRELNATGTAVSELLQWHLFETPEQAAQYFDSLIRDMGATLAKMGGRPRSLPPIYNFTELTQQIFQTTQLLPDPTWALSAFAEVSSANEICGYVYPANGSDIVLDSPKDYAGAVFSVWQGGKDYSSNPVAVFVQGVAQIWPPELVYNVWFIDPNYGFALLWDGNMTLTSPADWLGLGPEFCISISQPSSNSYDIYIDGYVGNNQYPMATATESLSSNSEMTVTPGSGFTQRVYNITNIWRRIANNTASSVTEYVPLSSVSGTIGSLSFTSPPLYPSMAFETDDTSSSFFNYNTNFAVELEMGPNYYSVGYWPLYYSISNDGIYCASQGYNIWGSSGVGTSWPPSPSSNSYAWGASGLTYLGTSPQIYVAVVGSLQRIGNVLQPIIQGPPNVVGISCSYVDTELTSLNGAWT
ncbi:MAG: hypothetical protein QXP98_01930 [Thermoproteus sp.]